MRVLTDNQVDLIIGAAPRSDQQALIWFLARTGVRIAEALALRWNAIDADQIRIPWLKRRGRRRERTLPLSSAAVMLTSWIEPPGLDADRDDTPIWPITASTAWRWIRAAGERAGIRDLHPHDLRHTFACRWLRRGGDLARLQHWLGHASLATTSIYLHSEPSDLRAEAERIGLLETLKPTPNHPRLPQGKRGKLRHPKP